MNYPITHYELMTGDSIVNTEKLVKEWTDSMNGDEGDFLEFCEKTLESDKLSTILRSSGIEQGNMAIRLCYHVWRMKCCGEKIYYISKDVCTILMNTRLTIDAEFIEAPFEEIYLYTDQDKIKMTDETGTKSMKGVYVNVKTERDGIKKLRFLATSGADGVEDHTDINHFACFHIPEHGNLNDICEAQLDKFSKMQSTFNSSVNPNVIKQIFYFVVNALIYIGCRNAELCPITPPSLFELISGKKSPGKIKKIRQKHKRSASKPFIYVKHSTPLPKQESGDGKKLDHEVLVGGYWRGQWYGPKGSQKKKVIRVDSYTKGVGLGRKKSGKYIVK